MSESEPTADDIVTAIGVLLADRRRRPYVTRQGIADYLGVAADDVSAEGSPTGPLLEAIEHGWIEPHPKYPYEWTLTDNGQARFDSALFT